LLNYPCFNCGEYSSFLISSLRVSWLGTFGKWHQRVLIHLVYVSVAYGNSCRMLSFSSSILSIILRRFLLYLYWLLWPSAEIHWFSIRNDHWQNCMFYNLHGLKNRTDSCKTGLVHIRLIRCTSFSIPIAHDWLGNYGWLSKIFLWILSDVQ
jgi:hypothetical protein